MGRPSQRQRRRLRAKGLGLTFHLDAFQWVAKTQDRVNILIEGDSWFAYPKEWLFFGDNANLVQNIFSKLAGKDAVNGLCLADNGDTVDEMLSGKQLKRLTKILRRHGSKVDLMLFSGGGNDVVGPDDLEPLLVQFADDFQPPNNFSAQDCLVAAKFAAKLDMITKRYEKLLSLRDKHAPQMKIICHTYDILKPSNKGAELLWGVDVSGPWILPTLQERNTPTDFYLPLIEFLLHSFRDRMLALQANHENFFVVDTIGTLRPGHGQDWLNEIHPTPSGFNRVGAKIYAKMREEFDDLPSLG